MRMRTQAEVMAHIRAKDPQTALTPWALRAMVLTGTIPSVCVGRKRLIDLDKIEEYLSPSAEAEPDPEPSGGIRPIRIVGTGKDAKEGVY